MRVGEVHRVDRGLARQRRLHPSGRLCAAVNASEGDGLMVVASGSPLTENVLPRVELDVVDAFTSKAGARR